MDQMYVPMKVVVVGDGAVGKTSMLLCYTTNTFPTDYMATVFDNYAVNVPYGDKVINLGLWDTAGQDEYAQYRPLSYDKADGFILAFSLISRASYENVATTWIKELRAKAPGAPIVLVGTKMDLRDGGEHIKQDSLGAAASFITTGMGEEMRQRIGAAAYVECSALTQDNLKRVFDTAIDVHMRPPEAPPAPPLPKGCFSCCFGGGGGSVDGTSRIEGGGVGKEGKTGEERGSHREAEEKVDVTGDGPETSNYV
mmetsp:Transcript_1199/g.2643  ORF Transcript_1199/g.2643 Transcript_1199/m.2643 type:complete len:254 (-) Transcript_1199:205-966(-)